MPDLVKLQENKQKIISTIKLRGPSFPTRISRETGISPLFVSAFLAELVSEKKLHISNMKIGSSPLYFIEGQEHTLEKFMDYLNPREKEAFLKLKDSQILQDDQQDPVIRVALRKLKDFALPVTVRVDGETKLFWKYFLIPRDQTKAKIEELVTGKTRKKIYKKEVKEEINSKTKEGEVLIQKPKISKPKQPSEFANNIKSYLAAKDIEILQEISSKKREFISKVRTDTHFGKQEYFLIAKDKKKITTNDLTIALQHAQTNKMPSLFLSSGEPDKKAQEHLKEWRNLIKFEQIKL